MWRLQPTFLSYNILSLLCFWPPPTVCVHADMLVRLPNAFVGFNGPKVDACTSSLLDIYTPVNVSETVQNQPIQKTQGFIFYLTEPHPHKQIQIKKRHARLLIRPVTQRIYMCPFQCWTPPHLMETSPANQLQTVGIPPALWCHTKWSVWANKLICLCVRVCGVALNVSTLSPWAERYIKAARIYKPIWCTIVTETAF